MNKVRLYAIPYAGGSAMVYMKWKKKLDACVELQPLELPGRGARFGVPACETLPELLEDLLSLVREHQQDGLPYALFGHSLGTLIAYELYYAIAAAGLPLPVHLFLSGRETPDRPKRETSYDLPDEAFIARLKEIGGTPDALFGNEELVKMFLPLLRKDLKINECYSFVPKEEQIRCDLTIMNGEEDEIHILDSASDWRTYGGHGSVVRLFRGGHFYLFENMDRVVSVVNGTLKCYVG